MDETTLLATVKIAVDVESNALAAALDGGQITPQQFFDRKISMMQRAMTVLHDHLGEQRFLEIFGEAGKHPEDLLDFDTFMASCKS